MKKYYIYNMRQANFYMQHGAKCLGVGKHSVTDKVYHIFGADDTEEVYVEWVKQCEEYKASQSLDIQ